MWKKTTVTFTAVNVTENTSEVLNTDALAMFEIAEIPTDLREIFEKILFILFLFVVYRDRQIKAVSAFYPSCSGCGCMQT